MEEPTAAVPKQYDGVIIGAGQVELATGGVRIVFAQVEET
jgi:hypothetical protein